MSRRAARRVPPAEPDGAASRTPIEIGLHAVIVAVEANVPMILVIDPKDGGELGTLPSGPFDPVRHRTMDIGLRAWVEAQTALRIGYAEQLYTFGDRGRHAQPQDTDPHVMSVGYLALVRRTAESDEVLMESGAAWRPWYDYFPWEDWQDGRPAMLDATILPMLDAWARHRGGPGSAARAAERRERVALAFGAPGTFWDEERVLDRFEILYEAGLTEEALRDGRDAARARTALPKLGAALRHDHRRILATALSRLRAKLKYRPLVFELMPESFTLTELQRTVEAISGRHLHKQNFRRLVETAELVEPTGGTSLSTGGRPAALFRFRRDVVKERPTLGLRVGGRG